MGCRCRGSFVSPLRAEVEIRAKRELRERGNTWKHPFVSYLYSDYESV